MASAAGDAPKFDEAPPLDGVRRKAIHQPKDKSAKGFYGDKGMVDEFLRKHVFGRSVADEAKAFLPFALGHEFLLVSEAEEAKALTRADTPRTAGLRLRYARDRAEFDEALAVLRELPEDSPARRALVEWVRSSMIEDGAKEEEMAELRELEDLASPVVDTWWAAERREARRKGLEEGRLEQRATLVRLVRRKFGSETAEGLAALLEGAADLERVAEVADLIIDCGSGRDFLAQAEGVLA